MPTKYRWEFSPGETRDLAVSLASELDSGASLTGGGTPSVSAWKKQAVSGEYDQVSSFTFSNEQVNTSAIAVEDPDGVTIETIAIGDGVAFRCTAPDTRGKYYLLTECVADDGTTVKRYDELVVSGPGPAA